MSTTTHDLDKSELISRAVELARAGRGSGGPPHEEVGDLLAAYYRHVAPEDLVERSESDVYGALASHYRLAEQRPQGRANVRVFTPSLAEHGWSAGGHSVVEVVTDDMPFLVDSLTMELSRQLRAVHLVVHPHFDVERDITGELQGARVVDDGAMEPQDSSVRESWMHVEIDRLADDDDVDQIVDDVQRVLRDVREAVEDWPRTPTADARHRRGPARRPAGRADRRGGPPGRGAAGVAGRRPLHLPGLPGVPTRDRRDRGRRGGRAARGARHRPGHPARRPGAQRPPSPGCPTRSRPRHARSPCWCWPRPTPGPPCTARPTSTTSASRRSTRAARSSASSASSGLFSSAAYAESLTRIPLLREKAREVLRRSGFDPRSYAGKALMDTLETYPRDELFHTDVAQLATDGRGRRCSRASVARCGRSSAPTPTAATSRCWSTCPATATTPRCASGSARSSSSASAGSRSSSRCASTSRPPPGCTSWCTCRAARPTRPSPASCARSTPPTSSAVSPTRRARGATTSWPRSWRSTASRPARCSAGATPTPSPRPTRRTSRRAPPRSTWVDSRRSRARRGSTCPCYEHLDAGRGEARLKVYRVGTPLSLSEVLPMLSSLGVEVVDERPYELEQPRALLLHLRVRAALRRAPCPSARATCSCSPLRAIWDGRTETDGFNALVLAAELTWRQVTVLRAYAKYMRQGSSPVRSSTTIEEALSSNVDITRLLVRLFEARFDPACEDREAREETLRERLARRPRRRRQPRPRPHPALLPDPRRRDPAHQLLPARPSRATPRATSASSWSRRPSPTCPSRDREYEVFVYSPRVEGVHLRFGSVARGGLRWSDRRDDFRTEVLGLVKAQMVKNTVIVPVGAKGGFFAKQLPDPGDREAWMAEGVASYRTFISGLLDITDNLVDGETRAPRRRGAPRRRRLLPGGRRRQGHRDLLRHRQRAVRRTTASGSATPSPAAARWATTTRRWASPPAAPGSRCSDTSASAGIDCQTEDFTCVGIGDMSGDVFGNGMLCSEHIRLVAAFDHRDIFLDPTPDAATSYAERQRLFELPRSSWQDYDTSLISEGGGVFSRSKKSIPITPQVREALGHQGRRRQSMAPAELMRAILTAPVDLLWNGGIGTYVKSRDETHADAGDKANDAIRVDGRDVRARCVGEGGNLGLTQAGRIEYARFGGDPETGGGRINTDFIDNSAGVDTSDHEVNIKILLDRVVADGDLTGKQRNELLAQMTDEVAALVLRDNYEQNLALANAARARALAAARARGVHEAARARGGPRPRGRGAAVSSREVRRRARPGRGADAARSCRCCWPGPRSCWPRSCSTPTCPTTRTSTRTCWPTSRRRCGSSSPSRSRHHPLRREIIVTQVVNDLVNGAGMTFWPRLAGETGRRSGRADPRQLRGPRDLRVAAAARGAALLRQPARRRRCRPGCAWRCAPWSSGPRAGWSANRRAAARQRRHGRAASPARCRRPMEQLPELMTGRELAAFEQRRDRLVERAGCPRTWRPRVAVLPPAYMLLGIVDAATREGLDPAEVAPGALRARRAARACPRWCCASWRCRATTAGRRWPAPRCATTCTRCTCS